MITLVKLLSFKGCGVMVESVSLRIFGMTCALCSATIESSLERLDGVTRIKVNYVTEKAHLEYEGTAIQLPDIIKKIELLGFSAEEHEAKNENLHLDRGEIEKNKMKRLFIISAVLSSPLILAMLLGGLGFCHDYFDPSTQTGWGAFIEYLRYKALILHDWRLQLALATPVQFIIGFRFYKNSFFALRVKKATMDLLVAIGTTVSYFYSIYILIFDSTSLYYGMKNVYFEASSVIITLVLLGKYLELVAKGRTSKAIQKLIALKPKTARVLRDGTEIDRPIGEVVIGDIIIVKPGEQVPVDGIIIEGYSAVDESMLTGESIPVDKKENDFVTGASLNQFGSFKFRVTKVGNETVLAHIIKMVEEAQDSRAPIQKIADKVCGYFVPFVLLVSLATFCIWYFIIFESAYYIIDIPIIYAVAVLVVSCPCALGLATPTAIMVGMGKSAQNGILIKNGEELEIACKITAIVLDKTGTITTGKPEVTDIVLLNHLLDENEVLHLAAIAEKKSEHPLGTAIYQKGKERAASEFEDPERFEAIPGKGIYAEIHGKTILIGTQKLMAENRIDLKNAEAEILSLYDAGKTAVLMAIDGDLSAMIALSDKIKENSSEVVSVLEKMGIEVYMLTGDNRKTAQAVANKIGIKNVIAEVLPENKAAEIETMKQQGKIVAMVGDGINDAPALATANIGFAIGTGSDVAVETGGIVLLKDDLTTIPIAIKLARKTMRKVKQNLFWAFIYNVIGIPFAATGNLNPVIAAAAMAFSSVSVLLNSLSLKRFNG
jgi:Cu+-exporting ATPase